MLQKTLLYNISYCNNFFDFKIFKYFLPIIFFFQRIFLDPILLDFIPGVDIFPHALIHIMETNKFFGKRWKGIRKIQHLWATWLILARACGVPVVGVRAVDCWQWRSGHYFHLSFLFFPPVFFSGFSGFFPPSRPTYSHRRSAQIKELILQKLLRMPRL